MNMHEVKTMKKGLLLIISGPAGSGKGTVLSHMLAGRDDFAYSVSMTTRAPRPGEVDGVNYHFVSHEEFDRLVETDGLLEYTRYVGNGYGTPRAAAEAVLASGRNLILEIEVDGAMQVKAKFPEAVAIMLLPPSFAVQEARLRGRGTETEEKIQKRLEQTRCELPLVGQYDYIVRNEDGGAEQAAADILAIVRAEQLKSARDPDAAERYFAD